MKICSDKPLFTTETYRRRKVFTSRREIRASKHRPIKIVLAKWLDERLKPLSVNDHTVSDIFSFADDLHGTKIDEHDMFHLFSQTFQWMKQSKS